jgi:uncharacterized membrane protein YraQ (UPF0718 family)
VTVALPLALVVCGFGAMLPHAAPLMVKFTESDGTGPPLPFLTAADTVDVAGVTLSAGMLVGLAVTVTEVATALVWVIVVEPLPPEPSVAVMVQKPTVVEAL